MPPSNERMGRRIVQTTCGLFVVVTVVLAHSSSLLNSLSPTSESPRPLVSSNHGLSQSGTEFQGSHNITLLLDPQLESSATPAEETFPPPAPLIPPAIPAFPSSPAPLPSLPTSPPHLHPLSQAEANREDAFDEIPLVREQMRRFKAQCGYVVPV
eukprot:4498293-Pyramimonas_sp.AAC.1